MSASREGAKGESSYAWKEDSKESFPLLYGGFIPSLCRGKMWETSSPSSHLTPTFDVLRRSSDPDYIFMHEYTVAHYHDAALNLSPTSVGRSPALLRPRNLPPLPKPSR